MYGKSTGFCYEFSAHLHRVSLRPRDGFWDVSISTETTLPTAFEDGVIQVRPGLDPGNGAKTNRNGDEFGRNSW